MGDIVTDEKNITVVVVEEGDVTVENLTYPTYVKQGDNITITYDVKNNNGDVTDCYTSIEESGQEILRWDGTLGEGETHGVEHVIVAGATNVILTIKAGYSDA